MKKTVLITGGSRGIGRACVEKFTKEGYETVFFYRNNDEAARFVSEETGALAIKCDISDAEDVRTKVAQAKIYLGVKSFDALVCNAGISTHGIFAFMSDEEWDEISGVNIDGTVYVTREAVKDMIGEKRGSVVLISSMWGETGASCEVAYSVTKSAIIGLAKSLAKEVGPSGIRVNCISPGVVNTDMNSCYSDEAMEELSEEVPLQRIAEPFEIANAVYFAASDEASYITGQVIGVNGGIYI